jgi:hypothetical protein
LSREVVLAVTIWVVVVVVVVLYKCLMLRFRPVVIRLMLETVHNAGQVRVTTMVKTRLRSDIRLLVAVVVVIRMTTPTDEVEDLVVAGQEVAVEEIRLKPHLLAEI